MPVLGESSEERRGRLHQKQTAVEDLIIKIIADLMASGPSRAEQIASRLSAPSHLITRALSEGIERGQLVRNRVPNMRRKLYRYAVILAGGAVQQDPKPLNKQRAARTVRLHRKVAMDAILVRLACHEMIPMAMIVAATGCTAENIGEFIRRLKDGASIQDCCKATTITNQIGRLIAKSVGWKYAWRQRKPAGGGAASDAEAYNAAIRREQVRHALSPGRALWNSGGSQQDVMALLGMRNHTEFLSLVMEARALLGPDFYTYRPDAGGLPT